MTIIPVVALIEELPEYEALLHVGIVKSNVACIVQPGVGEVNPIDRGNV